MTTAERGRCEKVAISCLHVEEFSGQMIADDHDFEATLERIRRFQTQVAYLRKVETNSKNYRLSASGFLAEIDRMQLDVRKYLSVASG